jgi:hypothetical protein
VIQIEGRAPLERKVAVVRTDALILIKRCGSQAILSLC